MNSERVRCPYCNQNLPGVERVGGTVAVRTNRSAITFSSGTLSCPCGAILVVLAGVVTEFAPPAVKPREVAELMPMELMKGEQTNAKAAQ